MTFLELLGLRAELPLDWQPGDPRENRTSPPDDVQIELALRNSLTLDRYARHAALHPRPRVSVRNYQRFCTGRQRTADLLRWYGRRRAVQPLGAA